MKIKLILNKDKKFMENCLKVSGSGFQGEFGGNDEVRNFVARFGCNAESFEFEVILLHKE